MAHIRESCSQLLYICSNQWIRCKHADMICDHHQIPSLEFAVHSTGCIAQEQDFCAQKLHQSCRKDYVRYRISFIIMYAPFHTYYRYFTYITKDKFTGMSYYSRYRESFDIAVIDFRYYLNMVSIIPKPGT